MKEAGSSNKDTWRLRRRQCLGVMCEGLTAFSNKRVCRFYIYIDLGEFSAKLYCSCEKDTRLKYFNDYRCSLIHIGLHPDKPILN